MNDIKWWRHGPGQYEAYVGPATKPQTKIGDPEFEATVIQRDGGWWALMSNAGRPLATEGYDRLAEAKLAVERTARVIGAI